MATALSLFDARANVLAAPRPALAVERVALERAHGRTLAEAITADGPWPGTDRAAMDGFAVRAAGAGLAAGAALPVVGESLAGRPFAGTLSAGSAIRIMTGAVVPSGADAVVPVEQTSGFQGGVVQLRADVRQGQHVRPRGSECAAGAEVLPRGRVVRAAEIGVLAVLGRTTVAVAVPPRVAILATGDEVVPVEREPEPHQVRESNSWALAAQVVECGGVPVRLGIAPDEPNALRALLQRGLREADVLVTIGGVSKGSHDLVHGELAALGVRERFHGLDLKPGKPTFFGIAAGAASGDGGDATRPVLVFGLPGNPASSFTVFDLLVRPLLRAWLGADPGAWTAALPWTGTPWQPNARLQAIPAALRATENGCALELAPPSPSGDPFGLAFGSAYALVPGQQRPVEGALVRVAGGSAGASLP